MKFLFVLLVPAFALAQGSSLDPGQLSANELRQEGQMVSVRMVRGEPLKIYVVGKEEGQLDLSKATVTVRRLKPYPGKEITTDLHDNYFVLSEPVDLKKDTDLDVTTKVKGKTETLHFKLEKKLP